MLADYYKVLGITRNATLNEIKKAYRAKVMEFHPDKNSQPDAHEIFVKINQAYEVLSNPIKRSKYNYIYFREEFNTAPKYSQAKEARWEETVKQAAETGKEKAEQYAKNYEYFSRRVMKTAGMELLIDVFWLLLGQPFSFLTIGLLLIVMGIIISIKFMGTNDIIMGFIIAVVGFLILRGRYLAIVRGEDNDT